MDGAVESARETRRAIIATLMPQLTAPRGEVFPAFFWALNACTGRPFAPLTRITSSRFAITSADAPIDTPAAPPNAVASFNANPSVNVALDLAPLHRRPLRLRRVSRQYCVYAGPATLPGLLATSAAASTPSTLPATATPVKASEKSHVPAPTHRPNNLYAGSPLFASPAEPLRAHHAAARAQEVPLGRPARCRSRRSCLRAGVRRPPSLSAPCSLAVPPAEQQLCAEADARRPNVGRAEAAERAKLEEQIRAQAEQLRAATERAKLEEQLRAKPEEQLRAATAKQEQLQNMKQVVPDGESSRMVINNNSNSKDKDNVAADAP